MRISILVLSSLIFSSLACAHPDFSKLSDKLGLSTAQAEELTQAHRYIKEEFNCPELKEKYDRRDCRMEAMVAIKQEFKEILTPEQYQEWRELRKERFNKRKARRSGSS